MTKSVCIVGAGPSGLVAAKALLHDLVPGTFTVTIFDAQARIGGLWPGSRTDTGGLVHPLMVANQSKHTVQFSDLAWRSSDPEFPKAFQVGRYLQRYAEQYPGADIRLNQKITKAELQDGDSWKIHITSDHGSETRIFDYLLVATGFFGKPAWPEYIPRGGAVPIIHSSNYRDLESLLSRADNYNKKILVIGGQMSGTEIAGTIATHLSSLIHSPGSKPIPNPERFTIHHIVQKPIWTFPLHTSAKPDAPAPPFLPVDLPSYNVALRPQPLANSQGHITSDAARTFHSIYQSILGTDQSEFSNEAKINESCRDEPPFLAMSMHYMDFVRSGLIRIHKGRLSSLQKHSATVSLGENDEIIDDVAAVILATGFDPSPSLSFLPSAVLETLSHSAEHSNLPVALAFHGTHHPSLPTLGFVGFYRSPYWGVMEMQARFVARLFQAHSTGGAIKHSPALQSALAEDNSIERVLALRNDSRCSQFPMGDYAFLMQEFAAALELPVVPAPASTPVLANGKEMDIITPARYVSQCATEAQLQQARENVAATYTTAIEGLTGRRFIAGAVFRSLLGEWSLERDLVSKLPSHPSGRFVGTARFLLREGTADGRKIKQTSESGTKSSTADMSTDDESDLGFEYLYIEDGEFTAAGTNMRFRATRRYIWRYDETNDALSVWFARTDDQSRADYLFHNLEFIPPQSLTRDHQDGTSTQNTTTRTAVQTQPPHEAWQAQASHLCVEDLYDVHYEFFFKAVNLQRWRLAYSVHGPKKDYTIDGVYKRKALI
ncbi:hypothetical protein F5Y16DRAFT_355108 [Xylariaceae sp. FL0255]|nr:hypothetical protein F5Y16DRAFT_355108 [Xylariaceae sp. FL0255]